MSGDVNAPGKTFDKENALAILRQNEDIRKVFGMLPWLPAMFTFLYAFVFTAAIQVVYYAATAWDRPVTNGQVLTMLAISLAVAIIAGAVIKLIAGKKMTARMKEKGIL